MDIPSDFMTMNVLYKNAFLGGGYVPCKFSFWIMKYHYVLIKL